MKLAKNRNAYYNTFMFLGSKTKKSFRVSLVTLLSLGLVFSIFCVFNYQQQALAHTHHEITSTYAQSSEACCGTNLQHHNTQSIATLKNAIRDNLNLLIFSLILFSIFISIRLFEKKKQLSILYRIYIKDNPELTSLNYLKIAFSQGILNPKKYNLAVN